MRKITINREKAFAACLMKVRFYVTDPSGTDTNIHGYPCRKLFDLKNGEANTAEIPETECAIYAIIDEVSKEFCNGSIILPAGKADISVHGKNKLSPLKGNPFVFSSEITVI